MRVGISQSKWKCDSVLTSEFTLMLSLLLAASDRDLNVLRASMARLAMLRGICGAAPPLFTSADET